MGIERIGISGSFASMRAHPCHRRSRRRLAWPLALAAGVAAMAAPVQAAPGQWTCWLHRTEQVACMSLNEADGPAVNAAVTPARTLMNIIRTRPGALRGQTIYIPLFTHPYPDSPLSQLASEVLCGPLPGECRVSFERELERMSGQAVRAFVDAQDPVLNRP